MFLSDFFEYRLFYQKKGRIKYISHLDVNRCMQRTLQRTGLPIWYTQGFHPHPYVTFSLPLSLGFESDYESMDFRLTEQTPIEKIEKAVSGALPEGLTLLSAATPCHAPSEIVSADYEIRLFSASLHEFKDKLESFLKQDSIISEKKTKKGMKEIDLKKELISWRLEEDINNICLYISLPAGLHMINPLLYLRTFCALYPNEKFRYNVLRKDIFCEGRELFK